MYRLNDSNYIDVKENYQLTINVDYCESGCKTAKQLNFSKNRISWAKINSEDIIFCAQFFPAAKIVATSA